MWNILSKSYILNVVNRHKYSETPSKEDISFPLLPGFLLESDEMFLCLFPINLKMA